MCSSDSKGIKIDDKFQQLLDVQSHAIDIMATKAMKNEAYNGKKEQATICEGAMKASRLRRFVRAFEDEKGVHLYT